MTATLCPLRNLNGGTLEPPKPLLSTPMDRTELWIVFAPAPGPVGTGAGSTMHNYSACRNFIKSSKGLIAG